MASARHQLEQEQSAWDLTLSEQDAARQALWMLLEEIKQREQQGNQGGQGQQPWQQRRQQGEQGATPDGAAPRPGDGAADGADGGEGEQLAEGNNPGAGTGGNAGNGANASDRSGDAADATDLTAQWMQQQPKMRARLQQALDQGVCHRKRCDYICGSWNYWRVSNEMLSCCADHFSVAYAVDSERGAVDEQAQIDAAVSKGLNALVALQNHDTGLFADSVGITALSGLALLAGGFTPTRGGEVYQASCHKALNALIENQDPVTGYLANNSFGRYYDHGFATLFIAECYGMSPDPRLRRSLEAAIQNIQQAQNHEGGWRYQANPVRADISVTICQIKALRAPIMLAWGAGIPTGD